MEMPIIPNPPSHPILSLGRPFLQEPTTELLHILLSLVDLDASESVDHSIDEIIPFVIAVASDGFDLF
jgi:hypothetical protein